MKKNLVAILGASDDKDRYSYLALMLLREHGYLPVPINPKLSKIEDVTVYQTLSLAPVASTLTIYVNPKISHQMQDEILKYPAKRVIFNPGTENFELAEKLRQKGVEVLEACTLVMLKTGQF